MHICKVEFFWKGFILRNLYLNFDNFENFDNFDNLVKTKIEILSYFVASSDQINRWDKKVFKSCFFFIVGGVTNTGEDKWPPLDNYQAPYREPILAPTTNSLTNSNGIISILPAPAKFNMQTNRLPRNIFLPSILLNPSKPAQVSFSLDWSNWNIIDSLIHVIFLKSIFQI